jgi:selenide, water dikinase
VRTGGDRRNREFAGGHVESGADEATEALAFDPQTAGGLLVAVPPERAAVLEATLMGAGVVAAGIGRTETGSGVVLR